MINSDDAVRERLVSWKVGAGGSGGGWGGGGGGWGREVGGSFLQEILQLHVGAGRGRITSITSYFQKMKHWNSSRLKLWAIHWCILIISIINNLNFLSSCCLLTQIVLDVLFKFNILLPVLLECMFLQIKSIWSELTHRPPLQSGLVSSQTWGRSDKTLV